MKYPEDFINKIIQGDVLTVLKNIPDDVIDLVITSPPYYGLRKYGDYQEQIGLEKTFDEYLKKILRVTTEIKRVLKPTGQFWLNLGDCYGGSMFGYGAKEPSKTGIQKPAGIDERYFEELPLLAKMKAKCMLMQPERVAIKMIDEQGWILRNKIKWAKQVLNFKEKRTYGSVMPTSAKDRFNESGEELYFFVKNKKYYSNLDAVRLPPQTELNYERPRMGQGNQTIYEQKRAAGIVKQRNYPESKYNKFNYRVRDAKRKAGQPQFKLSETEQIALKHGYDPEGICLVCGRSWKRHSGPNAIDRKAGIRREFIPCINYQGKFASNKNAEIFNNQRVKIQRNKVNDPRGNHFGGPGSWRDFKDNNKSFTNTAGKNLPTIWLIGSEPHNFQKELGVSTDHFAVFPQALCEIPIKFGCPPNGIVLDPFMGSGTTAIMAKKLGRNFIGIELNKDYIETATKRLNKIQTLL